MKLTRNIIFFIALIIGSFLAGSWYNNRSTVKNRPPAVNPPSVTAANEDADRFSSGTVRVSPEKQQTIGLRVGLVEKGPVTQTLRVLGRVTLDETRIYRLYAAVDGWIREVSPISTGALVKKGKLLATFYSPDFLAAEQGYILSLNVLGQAQAGQRQTLDLVNPNVLNVNKYIDTLRNLGMEEQQIQELTENRNYMDSIRITAPVAGFIINRAVAPGQRFTKGTEWFRLADQSQVWIFADTYENEARYLKSGMTVKLTHPSFQSALTAKVSDILPQFDSTTRTLKVRLEAANPGYLLKPDMFVNLEIPITMPSTIAIPSDAILDTGLKQTVFVDRGNGFFEPRVVETGWRLGNRVEIIKGLVPGEQIVTSGTFLIDSESRMEQAAAGITGSLAKDPVSGLEVSIRKAEKTGLKSSYRGQTFYFYSNESLARFNQNPSAYADKLSEVPGGPSGPKK